MNILILYEVPSQHITQKCQEALLKMKQLSEEVKSSMQKNSKATLLNHLIPYLVYFFLLFLESAVAQLRDI